MASTWQYFKCDKCSKEYLSRLLVSGAEKNNSYICECGNSIHYSEKAEDDWVNELDENGKRIRMNFSGSNEEECRINAANYFECAKEDIQNYCIVQKAGLFKKFIIFAIRPTTYEVDDDAKRILMWEYDNRPSIWADINLDKKTILYPYILGNEKQHFEKITGFKKCENSGACKDYILTLEPQGEVKFSFYPGYFSDIDTLIQIANVTPVNHGMFSERISARVPFDAEPELHLEIEFEDFYLCGKMRFWKKDNKICLLDTNSCEGIDISIDDIKYYRLIGQKYVTTEITGGGGGGSSLKGAVIGGLIAGEVGAIIGSRKDISEVKSTSTIHDEQVVLLYSTDLKQVISFNSNAYKVFTKLIPEKEYEVVTQSSNGQIKSSIDDTKSNADAVREYKKLLDEGIISQEEFDTKKKQLLGL